MSGIAGIWNLDGAPADGSVLARMSATLRHRGADGHGQRINGSIGFACQHLWVTPEEVGELQPLVSRDVMLVMDGRLDNRDELASTLRVPRAASDAAYALAAYEAWRERFAEKLNGDFAIAVFDERSGRMVLARDAIGLRPLYYFRSDRLFLFASEIKALLSHPDVTACPDDDGVADYMLHTARPLDSQHVTCFAGISALPPAHAATVTRERNVTRQYWDFDTGHAIRLGSFDAYVEEFRERFAQAVRRRIRSAYPVAISLSGGLDSSSIYCQAEELRQAGRTPSPRIVGVSYVGESGTDADEARYLVDIERRYHVELERFPIEPLVGLVDGAQDQIHAIEAPFFDYMWGVTRELHHRATRNEARVMLTGTWGDQMLFSCGYLVDLFRRLSWVNVWRHLREYREWIGVPAARVLANRFAFNVVRQHLPPPLIPPLKYLRRQLARRHQPKGCYSTTFLQSALRFADRPAAIGNGFHSIQAQSIYMQARSKYHVHCLEWNNKIAASRSMDIALPFLDRDLVAFLMAIPGEVQNWKGVPRALLREALRGVLPEPIRRRNWKADFSEVVNSGVAADAEIVAQALSRDALAVKFGYLDPERLAPEVARLSAGLNGPDCVSSWTLADLFGLEVWLEVFFGRAAATAHAPLHTVKEAS